MSNGLLVWSGGCDSTLILIERLKENRGIDTISFNHPQIPNSKMQAMSRTALKGELERRWKQHINHTEIDISVNGNASIISKQIAYPAFLMCMGAYHLEDYQTLYLGYIKGDDFWHFKQEALDIFDKTLFLLGKTHCKIEFPLEWKTKEEIITELIDLHIIDMVWWCETENRKPCGECIPCKTHQKALDQIKIDQEIFDKKWKHGKIKSDNQLLLPLHGLLSHGPILSSPQLDKMVEDEIDEERPADALDVACNALTKASDKIRSEGPIGEK